MSMKKPKIRFKGYTEDWEQRKLEDFGKATGGTSIESEFSEDGVYKVISIGSYSENSVYNDQGIRAIKSDKTSNRVLNRNDLTMILNDKTTSGNIIGRVLLIEESGIYVYNQRTERIEINLDEYAPVFLYEMLNAPNIREKIIKQAQGNTQIYVNWTTISLLEYMIPSKEEQVKIGEHLHGISNLITLHQRKCNQAEKLKKYMHQKMFPQNGEKNPEIRFDGFTDDWEQRKLGDIADLTSSKRVHAQDYVDSGIPFYRGKEISELREHKPVSEVLYITEEKYKEMAKLYGSPQVGDLLITAVGTIGNTWVVDNVPFYFKDGNLIWFKNIKCNPNYLDYVLSSDDGQKKIDASAIGSNQKALTMVKMNELEFMFPNDDEQVRIADYFRTLDHLITLHQRKCDELKKIKKFMLQNMFV